MPTTVTPRTSAASAQPAQTQPRTPATTANSAALSSTSQAGSPISVTLTVSTFATDSNTQTISPAAAARSYQAKPVEINAQLIQKINDALKPVNLTLDWNKVGKFIKAMNELNMQNMLLRAMGFPVEQSNIPFIVFFRPEPVLKFFAALANAKEVLAISDSALINSLERALPHLTTDQILTKWQEFGGTVPPGYVSQAPTGGTNDEFAAGLIQDLQKVLPHLSLEEILNSWENFGGTIPLQYQLQEGDPKMNNDTFKSEFRAEMVKIIRDTAPQLTVKQLQILNNTFQPVASGDSSNGASGVGPRDGRL